MTGVQTCALPIYAIERVNGYSWRHGDAISVGMVFAAELAHRSGLMTAEFLAQHRNLISRLGLPITYDLGGWDELIDAMAIDKKARGNRLRFIVLSAQGRAQVLQHPDSDTLADAFHALASSN